jgi:hypothetical protein
MTATICPTDFANPDTYADDIPPQIAINAHAGTSFSPERRGASEIQGWCSDMATTYANLRAKHATTPEKVAQLDAEWERFRRGLLNRELALLRSRAGIVSTMIAGGSNFPVRRMEKRNAAARRRLEEYLQFRERALASIVRSLHPEWRPIMAGDADALERLQEKLRDLTRSQELMREGNKIIRKHAKGGTEEQVKHLVLAGFTEAKAREILEPGRFGGPGFARFSLTNNGAAIRQTQKRVQEVEAKIAHQQQLESSAEGATRTGPTGIEVELAPAENRVRIRFPEKPDRATLDDLKRSGFRWAPSQNAHSAYYKRSYVQRALALAGIPLRSNP